MAEREDVAAEALCDLLDGLESGIVQARQRLKAKDQEKPKYDINKIKWTQAEGASGPYQRSEDVNSLDFKELLKDLEAHQGKLSRDGFFYWKFEKSPVIGRKLRQK